MITVRITARAVTVALAALVITSCNVINTSLFSPWTGLIERQARTSAEMPYDPLAVRAMRVVDDGTTEYVILFSETPGVERRIAVYDSALQPVFSWTTDPLSTVIDPSKVGSDDAGNVYIGLLSFGPGFVRQADLSESNLRGPVHVTPSSPTTFFVTYTIVASQLEAAEISSSPTSTRFALPVKSFDSTAGAEYVDTVTGYSHISGTVALASHDSSNNVIGGFRNSTSSFRTENVYATETVASPGGFRFPLQFQPDDVYVALNAVVITEDGSTNMIAHSYAGEVLGSLAIDPRIHHRAFSMAGDHFYLFDDRAETLFRVSEWW